MHLRTLAGSGPLLFFPVFCALISFNTVNESIVLKSKVSREEVCSLMSRILGCRAYLMIAQVLFVLYADIQSISYMYKMLIEALTYAFVI